MGGGGKLAGIQERDGEGSHHDGRCRCTPDQIARYRDRISGPLLDRIDLHIEVPAVPYQELAARHLRRFGVPNEAIETLPEPVSGTYEESLLLRRYATDKGLRSVLVVTSAYHSRRALRALRRVFADSTIAIGLDAVPPGRQTPRPAIWWLDPRGWQMVPGEYLKTVYYYLR